MPDIGNIDLLSSVRLRELVRQLIAQGSELQTELMRKNTVIAALLIERKGKEITFNPELLRISLIEQAYGLFAEIREPNIRYSLKENSDGRSEDPGVGVVAEVDGNPPSSERPDGDGVPPGSDGDHS